MLWMNGCFVYFSSIVKETSIEVFANIVINMERPVGLLSENHSVLAVALRIRLYEDNRRRSEVQGIFLLIEIVPSFSFSPRTNVYGRMSDRVFLMIEYVGMYKYIWLQRIYSLSITSRIFAQINQ